MSATFDPYCIYCDGDADGSHVACEQQWEEAQGGVEFALNSYAAPIRGLPVSCERSANGFTLLRTDEVQERLMAEEAA